MKLSKPLTFSILRWIFPTFFVECIVCVKNINFYQSVIPGLKIIIEKCKILLNQCT